MPASPREPLLCRYQYDALDRLDNSAPSAMDSLQHFYCKTRLATEIQGSVRNSIFQHEDQLLAQQRHENARIGSSLLATDQQRSVLNALCATGPQPAAYTPYGHRSPENGMLSLLGFNGERRDPQTGHYPLGNGYRQFNPVLMRFNSPDSLSPFGDGGLNPYGYCLADPVNRSDPTGHFSYLKVLIGGSSTVTIGAAVGGFVVEDKTARLVLIGLAFVAGLLSVFGTGILIGKSMSARRLQARSTVASRETAIPLQDFGSRNRPPGYWGDRPPSSSPPAYSSIDSTHPQQRSTSPRNSDAASSIESFHSAGSESQPSPLPRRIGVGASLSTTDLSSSPSPWNHNQSARYLRRHSH
jgi:RHS repeat-associated protein